MKRNRFLMLVLISFIISGCNPDKKVNKKMRTVVNSTKKTLFDLQDSKSLLKNEISEIRVYTPNRKKISSTNCMALAGKINSIDTGKAIAYEISIEYENNNKNYILFSRTLPLSMVSQEQLSADISKIVSYNEKKRIVYFDLGKSSFEYTLPNNLSNYLKNTPSIDAPPPPPGYERVGKSGLVNKKNSSIKESDLEKKP